MLLREHQCPLAVFFDHVIEDRSACFTSLAHVCMDGRLRGHTSRRLSPSFCVHLIHLALRLDCDGATGQDLHLVTFQLSQLCNLNFLFLNLCNGFRKAQTGVPLDDQALTNLGKLKLLEKLTILSPVPFTFSGDSLIRSSEGWSRMIQLILADGNFGTDEDGISHSVPIAVLPRLLSNMVRLEGIVFRVSEDAYDFPRVLEQTLPVNWPSVDRRRVFLDLMGSFCNITPTTSHPPSMLFNFLFSLLPVDIVLYARQYDLKPDGGVSNDRHCPFWREFWRSPHSFMGFEDSVKGYRFCYRIAKRKPVDAISQADKAEPTAPSPGVYPLLFHEPGVLTKYR
jgi:hypothetical protein